MSHQLKKSADLVGSLLSLPIWFKQQIVKQKGNVQNVYESAVAKGVHFATTFIFHDLFVYIMMYEDGQSCTFRGITLGFDGSSFYAHNLRYR